MEWWDVKAHKHPRVGSLPLKHRGAQEEECSPAAPKCNNVGSHQDRPFFACQKHFIPTTDKTTVGIGSEEREVWEGPVYPGLRNAGCSVSHVRAGGGFLLTPYVIHRLVRLAPSQEEVEETGELGMSQRNPRERCSGEWEAHPQHVGTRGTAQTHGGSVGSGMLGMDLGIIYTTSAAGDECFEPSNAATHFTSLPHSIRKDTRILCTVSCDTYRAARQRGAEEFGSRAARHAAFLPPIHVLWGRDAVLLLRSAAGLGWWWGRRWVGALGGWWGAAQHSRDRPLRWGTKARLSSPELGEHPSKRSSSEHRSAGGT